MSDFDRLTLASLKTSSTHFFALWLRITMRGSIVLVPQFLAFLAQPCSYNSWKPFSCSVSSHSERMRVFHGSSVNRNQKKMGRVTQAPHSLRPGYSSKTLAQVQHQNIHFTATEALTNPKQQRKTSLMKSQETTCRLQHHFCQAFHGKVICPMIDEEQRVRSSERSRTHLTDAVCLKLK